MTVVVRHDDERIDNQTDRHTDTVLKWLNVLFFFIAVLDRGLTTPWTYVLHLSLLSVILTYSTTAILSTHWCCPSRPCVVFPGCVHLASFLALSVSPGNSFVSSWCDLSMLASLLWQCLKVSNRGGGRFRSAIFGQYLAISEKRART